MAVDDLLGVEERFPHVITSFYPFFYLPPLRTKFYFDIEWQKPTAYVFPFKYQAIFAPRDVIVVALPRFSDSKFPRRVKKWKKNSSHCICRSGNTHKF